MPATSPVSVDPEAGYAVAGLMELDKHATRPVAIERSNKWPVLAVRVALDACLINLGFVIAYIARYDWQLGREIAVQNYVPISSYLAIQLGITVLILLLFQVKGLYRMPRASGRLDEISIIASSVTTAMAVLIVVVFLYRPIFYSRLIFAYGWAAIIVMVSLEKLLAYQIRIALWKRNVGVRRVLVVGNGRAGQRIMKDILDNPNLGYRLVGYVDDSPDPSPWMLPAPRGRAEDLVQLGRTDDIQNITDKYDVQEVIVALPWTSDENVVSVTNRCRDSGVAFALVPDLFEMRFSQVKIDQINGIPLIGLRESAIRGWNLYVKRATDMCLALISLVLTSPVSLAVALAVKLDSRGPVLFRQIRVGKGGREFVAYKFRSMCQDAERQQKELAGLNEVAGPIFKMHRDPRITRVGRFIRRFSLDELPQLLNIVAGHMSWVGPRPPIPSEVENYEDWHLDRLEVIPGLTGLWQISGRSDLSFDEMVKLDLYYAENWSLWLDLKILLLTLPAVISGKGAY
jgi:exopolysaccharide biosynthesis polyprenyl glycosylphosphotransferase